MEREAQQRVPERLLGGDFGPEGLAQLRAVVEGARGANRCEIARRACESMRWISSAGEPRLMSARAGLLKLHRAGLIQLPPPANGNANGRSRACQLPAGRCVELWPSQEPVRGRIDQLGPLWLRQVQGAKESALYYTLLERYHYLGSKLGGSPHLVRYFFGVSERLWGVIGFGPAAWKVAARDQFLGWQREPPGGKSLRLIVNNLRFLILPWVGCANLASQVLGRCGRQLPQDFLARYGYAPVLLETFVERERFLGSCYRAANWFCVGQTRGRGKRDQFHEAHLALKDVWLYPLRRDFRRYL
jgi:hypothetical protein